MFVFFGLGYFTQDDIFFFHLFAFKFHDVIVSFSLLSNTSLCRYTTFFLSILCFIHLSTDGHLGCFQFLAIMNNSAMNIFEQMSLCYDCASFGYIHKSSIFGSWSRLILIILISKVAIQVYTPTSNGGVFPLLHILTSISYHLCFWS